jgi:hypothetical protein
MPQETKKASFSFLQEKAAAQWSIPMITLSESSSSRRSKEATNKLHETMH